MTGYFSDMQDIVDFPRGPGHSTAEPGYRTCQQGAYWALKSHMTTAPTESAIVSLPTGAGKTALMMLAAFDLRADRVLVISPSSVSRTQTAQKFRKLQGLVAADAIDLPAESDDSEAQLPTVKTVERELINEDSEQSKSDASAYDETYWNHYYDSDVVVALPNNISKQYNDDICEIPTDKFDLVLVDEAHHSGAISWRKILREFEETPKFLFTATPFRRDRLSLPGTIVYHYPINRAIEDEIYQRVELTSVSADAATDSSSSSEDTNSSLVSAAVSKLSDIREDKPASCMLIKTENIDSAETLQGAYEDEELNVKAVHSKKSDSHNNEAIDELRTGELDAVVVVNKLSEGLDIENLQLAVLHYIPRSFPVTVQLLGRLARTSSTEGQSSHVLVSQASLSNQNIQQSIRRLYHEDNAWSRVVPNLFENEMGTSLSNLDLSDVSEITATGGSQFQPNFAVRVYEGVSGDIMGEYDETVLENLTLQTEFSISGVEIQQAERVHAFVTHSLEKPNWARDFSIEAPRFDLHLYYFPEQADEDEEEGFMFEYSSNQRQANRIRDAFTGDASLDRLDNTQLSGVMQNLSRVKYQATGLANASLPSGSTPQYKTYHGPDVQGAIRPSDSRVFSRGHVYATFNQDEDLPSNRGISTGKSKIWANTRDTVPKFVQWCDQLVTGLTNSSGTSVQNLELLESANKVDAFDEKPVMATFHPLLVTSQLRFSESDDDESDAKQSTAIEIGDFTGSDKKELAVDIALNDGTSISGQYNVDSDSWSGDVTEWEITAEAEQANIDSSMPLNEFFEEYPVYFYIGEGGAITGGHQLDMASDLSDFSPRDYLADNLIAWDNFGEARGEEVPSWYTSDELDTNPDENFWESRGENSVHEVLVHHLQEQSEDTDKQILFYDQNTGEIADVIEFDLQDEVVTYHHCKSGTTPGTSLGRIRDVQEQVLRTIRYLRTNKLLDRIANRNDGKSNQHFISGEDKFDMLESKYQPNQWDHVVSIVHPGLDIDLDMEDENDGGRNVGILLCACQEWVADQNATLKIYPGNDPDDL